MTIPGSKEDWTEFFSRMKTIAESCEEVNRKYAKKTPFFFIMFTLFVHNGVN